VAWGVPIAVRGRTPDGFNEFLDDFLEQAIEAREDGEAYVVGPLIDLRHGPFDARDAAPNAFRGDTRASMRVGTAASPPTAACVALGRDGQAYTVTWRTGTCPLQAGENDVQVCGVCRS
jgi:hypothetical protein